MTKARKRTRDCGRKVTALLAVGMLALCAAADKAPVKIIFDTDMIGDYDDVGAMAVLHKLADAGECEILATVSSTGRSSPPSRTAA